MNKKAEEPKKFKPYSENIVTDTDDHTEFYFCDENGDPIHKSKVLHKKKPIIVAHPFSYSKTHGLKSKKISTLEFIGWSKISLLPSDFRVKEEIKTGGGRLNIVLRYIKRRFPDVTKLSITKNGKNSFHKNSITLNWQDFRQILIDADHEKAFYTSRNKAALSIGFSGLTDKIKPETLKLQPNVISNLLHVYEGPATLSDEDMEALLPLLAVTPKNRVAITENFIKTKDKINFAFLEDVKAEFEKLLKSQKDNEKEWQSFFEQHGWILNNLFPFQVILRQREAYVGGKTIENKDGRVVDFLFQNGFKDNYALLEIKTHQTGLLKSKAYRSPDVFAAHEDLSGALSQCIDQKNTFLHDFGKQYEVLDPKVLLIVGQKSLLTKQQKKCFELLRGNQKNVEIVTYDELLQKIEGLMSILKIR